jgi:hypothetical protein
VTNRYLPLLLTLPLAVYGVALAVGESSGWSAVVALAALVTALPLLSPLWPTGRGALASPAVALVLAVGIDGFLTGTSPTGVSADVAVGVLVGAPLWGAGVIAGVIERPGLAFAAFAELLGQVVLLGATRTSLPGPVGTAGFAAAWGQVLDRQISGIAEAIATGGLGSPIQFPASTVTDPILILTAVLALAGLLLPLLPAVPSRRLPPAPVPRRDLAPPVRLVPPPVLNPPDSLPTAPRLSPGPTLAPAIGAIVAVAGFILLSGYAPRYSFLAITVACVAALGALVVLGSRGVPKAAVPPARAGAR